MTGTPSPAGAARPRTDVVVLGAGAAGLMCAAVAAARGRRVTVLEHNRDVGAKIRISGGGRCNFTNVGTGPSNFLSSNPRFATSALARFTPADFVAMVDRHGIRHHEKEAGQLFCDGSAREIVTMLAEECRRVGAEIVTGCGVRSVGGAAEAGRFTVETSNGVYRCESVVVATGGLSVPKLGASGLGYRIAEQFGLSIVEPRPGLVPFTLDGEDLELASSLSGASIDASVATGGASFRGAVLFTHRGLSGPAVLQASSYWTPGTAVVLDLSPDLDVGDFLIARKEGRKTLPSALSEVFPKKFAKAWCERSGSTGALAGMSNGEITAIARRLHRWSIVPSGTEGFGKAEVTVGGIDTVGLSSKTMESREVPGLYFIGEVVDVTGWLGGYNFQWAWASGFAAGQFA